MATTELTSAWRRQVRLIIGDLSDTPLLTDLNLDGLYAIEGGSVKRAAAQALDTIASSEALLSKKITSEGVTTDGPAVAKSLRDHAVALRAQASVEEAVPAPGEPDPADESFFAVVPFGSSAGPEGSERGYW